MMSLPELLNTFNQNGIRLIDADGRLGVEAPAGTLNAELKEAISYHKATLEQTWGSARPQADVRATTASTTAAAPPDGQGTPTVEAPSAAAVPALDPHDNGRGDYRLVNTPELFDLFVRQLGRQRRLAVDLETTGLDTTTARIVGLAISWEAGIAWYLPLLAPDGEPCLDYDGTLTRLRPILEDPSVAKVNQNIKYDQKVLRRHGIRLAGVVGDSMVADYLLRPGDHDHDGDSLALRHLGHHTIPITELIGKKKPKQPQLTMDQVPTAEVCTYASEDADMALRLCDLLEGKLAVAGVKKLYDELEVPLIEVIAEMEFNGIRVDVPLLKGLGKEMAEELEGLEESIYACADHPFNIASTKQLRKVLFGELGLPVVKTTAKGDPSTDSETLAVLAKSSPVPELVLQYRVLAKLKGTYVDALPKLVSPTTKRLHTSFNQAVTATGRLSSSAPNLQNIPARTALGKKIRQAIVPEDGWLLMKADYSQIELRMLAHFCGDGNLRRAYQDGRDIHALVAAQVNGVTEDRVTADMRRFAKTINFGVIYGMSSVGLAKRLGITQEEGAKFIDAYFARYPTVSGYQDKLLEECRRLGYVSTILGRRRRISGIRPCTSYRDRNRPEREGVNMPIQGSAADLMKLAMLNVYRRLRREGLRSRMLLTVHDELVFEVPPDEKTLLAELVREEMEEAMTLEVPLKAELAAGPNWGQMETI